MRTKHLISASLLLAMLVFVGIGCGQKAPVSADATSAANKQPVAPPTSVPSTTTSDSCSNPYYAYRPGLTIAYGVTPFMKVAGDSDYTTRVVSVSGNMASISVEMADGTTSNLEVDCADGSIADTQDLKFKTTIVSSSGTFMPPDVRAGSTWSNSQTVKMESPDGSAAVAGMGPLLITTSEQSRAVAEESVTILAGTYKAIKVELTSTSTNEFTGTVGAKLSKSPPSTSTSTEWWVKGIGVVKTVTTSEDRTSTVEAKSITGL